MINVHSKRKENFQKSISCPKFKRLSGLIRKEFIEYLKDKVLFLVYTLPIALILVMGYGINFDTEHIRTIIVNQDKTPVSYKLEQNFYNTKYFDSETLDISLNKALNYIKLNKTDLIIAIPSSFEKNIVKGDDVHIGVYMDGTYPIICKTMDGYVSSAIRQFVEDEVYISPYLLYEPRNLFNQSMKTSWAIIPGAIALIILLVPAMFSALMIVREKEHGTVFNFFSSPLTKIEFMLGKIIPAFVVNIVTVYLLLLLGIFFFGLPFRGSFVVYTISSIFFLLISIGIGLLVSVITESQVAAIILTAIVTIIPGILYAGLVSPIDAMEGIAYYIARVYPIMYYVKIMYDCFLVGDGFSSHVNITYIFILSIFTFVIYFINYLLLSKKI